MVIWLGTILKLRGQSSRRRPASGPARPSPIRNGLLVAALCFGTFWSATAPGSGVQLPPQVLLDQLLLRIDRLVEADDLDTAVQAMEEALALAAEHELELPADFRFEQGRTEFAVGLLGAAKESVIGYLAVVSREAESYVDAVELLEDVDRILERRDAPECSPLPEGPACWMELTSQPGCYVWNPAPQATETATWTGKGSAGFAQGPGTVTWTYRDGEQEEEGNLRYGRRHGHLVLTYPEGHVAEGPFVHGEANGHWVLRHADLRGVHEGPYVDGEKRGHWILRFADGRMEEGPYVAGEKNGHWVFRQTDGAVGEGPCVEDEMNGHWVFRWPDGQVQEGPYVNGEKHGRWRTVFPDGEVTYEQFVRGVRQEP